MYQKIISCGLNGLDSGILEIEIDITNGMPYFNIIGITDNVARGIRERIRSAIAGSGFTLSPHKITVNCLQFSSIPIREGIDLPIAIGLLCAERRLPSMKNSTYAVIGNLALNGEVRSVHGIVNIAACCRNLGYTALLVPYDNAEEASLLPGIRIFPVHTLQEAADFWADRLTIQPYPSHSPVYQPPSVTSLEYIRGQLPGKRALEITAAGFHNLLFCGPPGCGKTLLLQALAALLPPPSDSEIPDLLRIRSIYDTSSDFRFTRPVRQPHHSLSSHALIGGGHPIRPGEITRAHGGVLLLDEIAEFSRSVLDNLRQPLESHDIRLHYLDEIRKYPADFLLAATMNLCPCGLYPDRERCTCHPHAIRRYQNRLGTPLIERFDLCLMLEPVPDTDTRTLSALDIREIQNRIQQAVQRQQDRFRNESYSWNSRIHTASIDKYCRLTEDAAQILHLAAVRMRLSMRSQHNIKKTARTIADLADHPSIEFSDIAEALQYRPRGFLNLDPVTEEYTPKSDSDQSQTSSDQTKDFSE